MASSGNELCFSCAFKYVGISKKAGEGSPPLNRPIIVIVCVMSVSRNNIMTVFADVMKPRLLTRPAWLL